MFLNQICVSETKTIQNFWKKVMHIVRRKKDDVHCREKKTAHAHLKETKRKKKC